MPTGASWSTSLNTNIAKQAIVRTGHNYGDTNWSNANASVYDCSGLVWWAILSADSRFKITHCNVEAYTTTYYKYGSYISVNKYENYVPSRQVGGFMAGIPEYAEGGWSLFLSGWAGGNGDNSFSGFRVSPSVGGANVKLWLKYETQNSNGTWVAKDVPVLRCFDVEQYKKAIYDPALKGWFIILSKDTTSPLTVTSGYTYGDLVKANALKEGMVINTAYSVVSGGRHGNHTGLSLGKMYNINSNDGWTYKFNGTGADWVKGTNSFRTAFMQKYPQSTFGYSNPLWIDTRVFTSSQLTGRSNNTVWKQLGKNEYSPSGGTQLRVDTSNAINSTSNSYLKIESTTSSRAENNNVGSVNINNLGWGAASTGSGESYNIPVVVGYFNTATSYYEGSVKIQKVDSVTGNKVAGAVYVLMKNTLDVNLAARIDNAYKAAVNAGSSADQKQVAIDTFMNYYNNAGSITEVMGIAQTNASGAVCFIKYYKNSSGHWVGEPTKYNAASWRNLAATDSLDVMELWCPSGYDRDKNVYKVNVKSTYTLPFYAAMQRLPRTNANDTANYYYAVQNYKTTQNYEGRGISQSNSTWNNFSITSTSVSTSRNTNNLYKTGTNYLSYSGYTLTASQMPNRSYLRLGISKVDFKTGNLVAGAQYHIFNNETAAKTVSASDNPTSTLSNYSSNIKGSITTADTTTLTSSSFYYETFTNGTTANQTYWVAETVAPNNYDRNKGYWKVVVTPSRINAEKSSISSVVYYPNGFEGQGTATKTVPTNKAIGSYIGWYTADTDVISLPDKESSYYTRVRLRKNYGSSSSMIAGATFNICTTEAAAKDIANKGNNSSYNDNPVVTVSNQSVMKDFTYSGTVQNHTYWIAERIAPSGYERNTGYWKMTVTGNRSSASNSVITSVIYYPNGYAGQGTAAKNVTKEFIENGGYISSNDKDLTLPNYKYQAVIGAGKVIAGSNTRVGGAVIRVFDNAEAAQYAAKNGSLGSYTAIGSITSVQGAAHFCKTGLNGTGTVTYYLAETKAPDESDRNKGYWKVVVNKVPEWKSSSESTIASATYYAPDGSSWKAKTLGTDAVVTDEGYITQYNNIIFVNQPIKYFVNLSGVKISAESNSPIDGATYKIVDTLSHARAITKDTSVTTGVLATSKSGANGTKGAFKYSAEIPSSLVNGAHNYYIVETSPASGYERNTGIWEINVNPIAVIGKAGVVVAPTAPSKINYIHYYANGTTNGYADLTDVTAFTKGDTAGYVKSNTVYTPEESSVQTKVNIKGTKMLDGKQPNDATFSFTLTNTSAPSGLTKKATQTRKNVANGDISFDPITFVHNKNLKEEGTWVFTLKEVASGQRGIIYDTHTCTITVKVAYDAKANTMSVTKSISGSDVFDNTKIRYYRLGLNKVNKNNVSVDGAIFTLHYDNGKNSFSESLTTGTALKYFKVFSKQGEGCETATVVIKETKAPKNYIANNGHWEVVLNGGVLSDGSDCTIKSVTYVPSSSSGNSRKYTLGNTISSSQNIGNGNATGYFKPTYLAPVEVQEFEAEFGVIKTDTRNGKPVKGVEFTVYKTFADAQKKTNPVSRGITGANGQASLYYARWYDYEHSQNETYFVRETSVANATLADGKKVKLDISNDITRVEVIGSIKGSNTPCTVTAYTTTSTGARGTKLTLTKEGSLALLQAENDETVLNGTFGVFKKDAYTGKAVKGIKFDIYSNANLTTKVSTITTDSKGLAWYNIPQWYETDYGETRTFYVRENQASAEKLGYNWCNTVYKVIVSGAEDASNSGISVTAVSGLIDKVEKAYSNAWYFVQENRPISLYGAVGLFKYFINENGKEVPVKNVQFTISDGDREYDYWTNENGYIIYELSSWYKTEGEKKTVHIREANNSSAIRCDTGEHIDLKPRSYDITATVTGAEDINDSKVVYSGHSDTIKISDTADSGSYITVVAFKEENLPQGLEGEFEVGKIDDAGRPVENHVFNVYPKTAYVNGKIADDAKPVATMTTDKNGIAYINVSTLSDGVVPAGEWKASSIKKVFYVREQAREGYTCSPSILMVEVEGAETAAASVRAVTVVTEQNDFVKLDGKWYEVNTKTTSHSGIKQFASTDGNTRVSKVWLTLYLKQGNNLVQVTKDVDGNTISAKDALNDKAEWTNLPYYTKVNNSYVKAEYTVVETKVVLANGKELTGDAISDYYSVTYADDGTETTVTNTEVEISGQITVNKDDGNGNPVTATFGVFSNSTCTKQIGTINIDASGTGTYAISLWKKTSSLTKTVYLKEIKNDGAHVKYPYIIKAVVTGAKNSEGCEVKYSVITTGADVALAEANGYTTTISTTGTYTVNVPNYPTELYVSKRDVTDTKELNGAKLAIYKATGTADNYTKGELFTAWTSNGSEKVIYGIPAGSYVLVETSSPDGYAIAEEGFFTIDGENRVSRVKMIDDYTNTYIYKVDINGDDVSGATLGLYDGNKLMVSFTTGKNGKIISQPDTEIICEFKTFKDEEDSKTHTVLAVKKLAGDHEYTVKEITAPAGWALADDVTFKANKTTAVVKAKVIEQQTTASFSKVDKNGHEIEGATLTLYKATGETGHFVKGEKYASWVSTTIPHIETGIPAGKYILEETSAPTDHGFVRAESIEVVIRAVPELQVAPPMIDDCTELHIKKTDMVTGKEIKGAELQLIDSKGKVVLSWTTGDKATIKQNFSNSEAKASLEIENGESVLYVKNIPVGTYTLREITAPDGKMKAEDVIVKVLETAEVQKAEMVDEDYPVTIKKTDMVDGKPVKGATLTIYYSDKNGTKGEEFTHWTTDASGEHTVKGIKNGWYILEETNVPNGYTVATPVRFYVDNNEVADTVEMKDDRLKGRIEIYKKNPDNEAVEGAKFGLYKGDKLLETLTTNGKGYAISKAYYIDDKDANGNLYHITYTLKELEAPAGYINDYTDKNFVFTEGTLRADGYRLTERAVNKYTEINIDKYEAGTKNRLAGCTLAVFKADENGNAIGDALDTWTTNGKTSHSIKRLPVGKYILRELDAPEGYALAEDVLFTVGDTADTQIASIEDAPLMKLPSAGKTDGLYVLMFSLISILSGVFMTIRRRRTAH
jgi:pilin isopeptide linkage protein